MSIQLVTYANQTVTPTNDAIIYEKAVDQNGIFYGCNVTVTSNNVNITGGYGLVCGREFVINSDSIAVTLAPSGTLEGRLYVRLDLADADAPIQLLTATGNTLPPLVQDDDVNYTNGTYEMELATFTVGVSSLSDVVETFETIEGVKTKVLSLTPTFEYVGVVNQIHWSEWVAPDNGIVVMDIGWNTGGGFGYYYVKDATDNVSVGKVTTYSINGTSITTSFPVIKGHTYKDEALSGVNGSQFYFRYYKIKLTV